MATTFTCYGDSDWDAANGGFGDFQIPRPATAVGRYLSDALPGTGRSGRTPGSFWYRTFSDVAIALLRPLKSDEADIERAAGRSLDPPW